MTAPAQTEPEPGRGGRFWRIAGAGVLFQGGAAAIDANTILAALVFGMTTPGTVTAQRAQGLRRGIQLELKELENLGVLNGPDLALMDELIPNPVSDVFSPLSTAFGVFNIEERVSVAIEDLKERIALKVKGAKASIGIEDKGAIIKFDNLGNRIE